MAVSLATRMPKGKIDRDKANHALGFIGSLKHTKGEWAGLPFQIAKWQHKIIVDVFGTVKPNGYRQYRDVYIEIPKKNGKSEFAAALALYLLCADDEYGAEVYGAATDRQQAGIVFGVAREMVHQSPSLSKRLVVTDSVKNIAFLEANSFYRVLSSEAFSKHGYNIHGLVIDELHAQPNRELVDVLTEGTGAARRQPLRIYITTAGVNRESICWEMHEKARQILNGTITDPSFYAVIYGPPDDEADKWDWEDESNWKKVNPGLGTILDIQDMRHDYQDAKRNVAKENSFKQLRLNIWVKQSLRWMKLADWDKCRGDTNPESLKGQPCWAGLDLSSSIDLTAFVLDFPRLIETRDSGGKLVTVTKHHWLADFWVPEDTAEELGRHGQVDYTKWIKQGYLHATPGNVIDYDCVLATIKQRMEQYDIRELAFDRWGSQQIQGELGKLGFKLDPKETGAHLVQFGQGFASMSSPTKELMTLVLQGNLEHGGNPVLRWNADNMVINMDPAGNIKPNKTKATQKIDGMVAGIMALDRAIRHAGDDGKSVYADRGLIVI